MTAKLKRSDVFAAFSDALNKRDDSGRVVLDSELADALQIILGEYGQGLHANRDASGKGTHISLDAAFGLPTVKVRQTKVDENRIRALVLREILNLRARGVRFKQYKDELGAYQMGVYEAVVDELSWLDLSVSKVEEIWSEAINNEWIGTPEDLEIHIKGFSKIGR